MRWQDPHISSATACMHQKKNFNSIHHFPSLFQGSNHIQFWIPFSPNSKQLLHEDGCIVSPYFGFPKVQQSSHTCRVVAVKSLAYIGYKMVNRLTEHVEIEAPGKNLRFWLMFQKNMEFGFEKKEIQSLIVRVAIACSVCLKLINLPNLFIS